MIILKDKINQALNRITYARNEWRFCISILEEKKLCEERQSKNDFSDCFYTGNQYTLDNLYFIILRMVIIDLFTLVNADEKNSYIKITNSIKFLNKKTDDIDNYEDMIEYVKRFEDEIVEFKDIIERIEILRNVYVAHTDGEIRRNKYSDIGINVNEIGDLIKKIFAFLFNVQDYVENRVSNSVLYLMEVGHIGNGSNNSFEKMRKKYEK